VIRCVTVDGDILDADCDRCGHGGSHLGLQISGYLRPCLNETHQFPDGTIVETLHAFASLELLDHDLAGEAG